MGEIWLNVDLLQAMDLQGHEGHVVTSKLPKYTQSYPSKFTELQVSGTVSFASPKCTARLFLQLIYKKFTQT